MLAIKDLISNNEMTKQAMSAVYGGGHGIGNYRHLHTGPWKRKYYRAFRVIVRRGHKRYLAIQRQWTYCRCQYLHVGRLSYLRPIYRS